jgi:chorismate synthase
MWIVVQVAGPWRARPRAAPQAAFWAAFPSGLQIVCKIAVKPTPSIAKKQSTVDLARGEAAEIEIKNRHDPAIPPRIVPVAEAMVALVLADHLLCHRAARLDQNDACQRQ